MNMSGPAPVIEPDFRAIFDAGPGLYLVLTPELTIIAASRRYLDATMADPERLVGRCLFDALAGDPAEPANGGVENMRASLRRVLATRAPDVLPQQRLDIRRPDSSIEERHWSVRNTPVLDSLGNVRYIIHEVEDVTAEVAAESARARSAAALHTSEELLRCTREEAEAAGARLADARTRLELTLAASEIGTWLWDSVNDRVLADRNLSRMFGLTGTSSGEARLADFVQLIHPDDRSRVERAIATTLGSAEPYEIEYRIALPDGSIRYVLARGRPERGGHGVPAGLHGVALDITDRVRAEQAHRALSAKIEQQARIFDTTLSSITDFAYVFDPDGRFVFVNKALLDLWGLPLEQAVGRNFFDLKYPADLAAKLHQQICHVFATGERLCDETRYTSPSGGEGFYEYIFSPVRAADGAVELVAGSTRDITSRKATEERLQRLLQEQRDLQQQNAELLEAERMARTEAERVNRIKDDFLATLSHELRTPLNSILGWAEYLDGGRTKAPELEEGLAAIGRNAHLQARMIEDLLDLSRIVAGKLELEMTPVPLGELLLQTIRSLQPLAAVKKIAVTRSIGVIPSMIVGAADRLQQVFWNIIANAIKFTPPGGRVDVSLAQRGELAEVRVVDSGEGIDAAFLPHVFERFRQGDSNITRTHGGLGIGLSIVRQLVELHGGTVTAQSHGRGRGASFTVALPLLQARRPAAAPLSIPVPGVQFEGVRVLVVDDDHETLQLMERIFAGRFAHVLTAASAADALALLQRDAVDLLISDVGMPGQDGYQLMRRVRSLSAVHGGAVPSIAVTAYARPEDRTRALQAGFQAHVAKPIQQAELLRVCAGLLSRK